MKLIEPKKCSCGKEFSEIPDDATHWIEPGFIDGFIFNCECKSTIYVPVSQIKEAA